MTIKIGDVLWGVEYGRPDRWRSLPVTGETKQSWLLGPAPFKPVKVNKKTMLESVPNYGSIRWFTLQGKVDEMVLSSTWLRHQPQGARTARRRRPAADRRSHRTQGRTLMPRLFRPSIPVEETLMSSIKSCPKRRRLHWIWSSMNGRCRNPKDKSYKNYGARGISVCERWAKFSNFEKDMGFPAEDETLERKDNDGDYSPSNCEWASRKKQNSNRRSCVKTSLDGREVTLAEYCRVKRITYRSVIRRVTEYGWPIELAVTVPVGQGCGVGRRR